MPAFGQFNDNSVDGIVEICVMTETGCRKEDVVVSEKPSPSQKERMLQSARLQDVATGKALAQLGKQGWEMIAVVKSPTSDASVVYFKRHL